MDCEKFESTLLDELYDELDEVTSAAAKRHVGGCSRCASLLSGLKTTRRLAVLPIVEPPADLEDRILLAAREAQKVVPFTRRASRVVSRAGSWAMRPQTGMAAVFLLGIGLSALLLQGRHAAPSSAVTVSERGEPVANVATGTLARPPGEANDTKGASPAFAAAPAPAPLAATAIASAAPAGEYGTGQAQDGMFGRGRAGAGGPLAGRINGVSKSAASDAPVRKPSALDDRDEGQNAAPVAGAPAQPYAAAPPPAPARHAAPPPATQAAAQDLEMDARKEAPAPNVQSQMVSSFDTAMAAYKSGDYATAKTQFDAIAARGDLSSALWAARSARDGTGCASAVARFDQVASAAAGTNVANDATLEAGRCYRQMNQAAAAQARFQSLLTLPAYVDRASNELAAMAPKPAAKARPPAAPAKPAAPPAASPPPVSTAY